MGRYLLLLLLFIPFRVFCQKGWSGAGKYQYLSSGNLVADKNFYLLTVISHSDEVKDIWGSDSTLNKFFLDRATLMAKYIGDTCIWPNSLVEGFRYSLSDSLLVDNTLTWLYNHNQRFFNYIITQELRPSGYYQLFAQDDNLTLLLKAWGQVVKGNNYIIDQFGLSKKLRYPNIDSATYYVNSPQFRNNLKEMFAWAAEQKMDSMFYSPSLLIALQLMELNGRNEPERHEPLEKGVNKAAYDRIGSTNFDKYSHSCILVLGSGPEIASVPISPMSKMRCDIAAKKYRDGLAPFIITSGGYVTPFRGPYCEALEMKKYLIEKYGIPENAIITDPFARHTTTNIRNANRLIFRYGIPTNKPVLVVSAKSHIETITSTYFDARNMHELGYLPYLGITKKGLHEAEYKPNILSLHMDPGDPLDP